MKSISLTLGSAALALIVVTSIVRATPIPLIQMDDVPLTDAIRNLARQAELNYILDPLVPGSSIGPGRSLRQPLVTARWENLTAEQALEALLQSNSLAMIANPATTVARIVPTGLKVDPAPFSAAAGGTNAPMPLIVLSDVSLSNAIAHLSQEAGVPVSWDRSASVSHLSGLNGEISIRWQNLSARQALSALLDNYGFVMAENHADGTAVIRPARAEPRIIPLIKMEDVPLLDAIKNLAREAGLNYIIDPRVPGSDIGPGRRSKEPIVNASWEAATARQALDDVLKSNKLVLVPNPVTTIARIVPANTIEKPAPADPGTADTGEVIPLIVADQVPLDHLLKTIARQAGLKATLSREITSPLSRLHGTVSVRWEDVTFRQALGALVENYDLVMIEDKADASATFEVKPNAP